MEDKDLTQKIGTQGRGLSKTMNCPLVPSTLFDLPYLSYIHTSQTSPTNSPYNCLIDNQLHEYIFLSLKT